MADFGWLADLVAQVVFEDTNARAQRRRWNLVGLDVVDDSANAWLTISPDLSWIASEITTAPTGAVSGNTFAIGSSSDLVRSDHVHRFGRDPTDSDEAAVRLTYDSSGSTGAAIGLRIQETDTPTGESTGLAIVDSTSVTVLSILLDATIRGAEGTAGNVTIASGASSNPGTIVAGDVQIELGEGIPATGYLRCMADGTTFFGIRKSAAAVTELHALSNDLLLRAGTAKEIIALHAAPTNIPATGDKVLFLGDADVSPTENDNAGVFLYSVSPGRLRAMSGNNENHDADLTYGGDGEALSTRRLVVDLTILGGGTSDEYDIDLAENLQAELFVSVQAYDDTADVGGGVYARAYYHHDAGGVTLDGSIISAYVGVMSTDSDTIGFSVSSTNMRITITNVGSNSKTYRLRIVYHTQRQG